MLELMKQLDCDKTAVLGYRDSDMFLKDEFEAVGDVVISTEDGSFGTKEMSLMRSKSRAWKEASSMHVVQHQCFEESKHMQKRWGSKHRFLWKRMACGIGACLACVCKSKDVDSHSHVHNKRVCKDGPVFDAREVEL